MDIIIGIVLIILLLVLEIVGAHLDLKATRWLRRKGHPFTSKLLVAVLTGFMVFVLITDRISRGEQKAAIILVSALLIWANLYLGPTKPDKEE
jgi:xanthine/uracil/vitamin C permease (AzgA family)